MIDSKRIIVVLPAYNAAKTLEKTYSEIPFHVVDDVVLVDDASRDDTVLRAKELGIRHVLRHPRNRGYGANQKSCYEKALELGADVVVMLHPDYQYPPRLILPLASLVASGMYEVALGSRILGGGALRGGMPLYKYVGNRFLTMLQNILLGQKLSEYHTGYRAFSRRVLQTLPLGENRDDFIFDNQMITQAAYFGFRIAEVTCPTSYGPDSSSISFVASVRYGLGVLRTAFACFLARLDVGKHTFLNPAGRKLAPTLAPPAAALRAATGSAVREEEKEPVEVV